MSEKGNPEEAGKPVQIQTRSVTLEGNLSIPRNARGMVVFVHGSGSSRHSPRNQYVAKILQDGGLATLLFDLLTQEEEQEDLTTRHFRFDIGLLASRTVEAASWLRHQEESKALKIGYFGSSTGAAAALIAAAEEPGNTGAVVSRGGRPDLAASSLEKVHSPVLLIVGERDYPVIELNEQAANLIPKDNEVKLEVVPEAGHLFEEPGALEKVANLARDWFNKYLEG
jgi:putative phosphoribosyl transferase